jgi:hypothetical protein
VINRRYRAILKKIMTKGAIGSIVTGIMVLAVMVVSAAAFLMSLILALNGYMGQDTAVDGSFITFIVLGLVSFVIAVGGGCRLTYYLTERRAWHAAGSAILSIFLASVVGVGLHLASVIIAVIVAEALRTGK